MRYVLLLLLLAGPRMRWSSLRRVGFQSLLNPLYLLCVAGLERVGHLRLEQFLGSDVLE